ncbi:MAG: hypothetical protein K6A82_08365 [Prevotella sp.]|nr:hypothetical protein [Prevotella sp.]
MEKAPSIIAWAKRIAWIAIFVIVIGGEFFVYRRCTSERNFRFDIAKQAFMVDYGDVCGLGLFIEGETSDDFYHIENHAAPSGLPLR